MARELYFTPLFNDANLVSYWRMEGNSNDAKDSNNGTDTSITYSLANGKFGQGAGFDGSSSLISLASCISGGTARTFNCWIKPTSVSGIDTIYFSGQNINNQSFGIYENVGSTNDIYISFSGQDYFTPTNAFTADIWQMLSVVYDGGDLSTSTVHVYINAVSKSLTETGVATGAANTTNSNVRLGTDPINSGRNYSGSLDDVAIFSRALTATEISNLYNGTWPSGAWFAFA